MTARPCLIAVATVSVFGVLVFPGWGRAALCLNLFLALAAMESMRPKANRENPDV